MIRIGIWEGEETDSLNTTVFLQYDEDRRFVAYTGLNNRDKTTRKRWTMNTTVMELHIMHELTRVPL